MMIRGNELPCNEPRGDHGSLRRFHSVYPPESQNQIYHLAGLAILLELETFRYLHVHRTSFLLVYLTER